VSSVNDIYSITHTTETSVGGLATNLNAFTNTSTATIQNCPYTTADVTGGSVLVRTVAYGVRVKYRGKLMDRNGVCYPFEEPDNQDQQSKTFSTVSNSNYSKAVIVGDGKWDSTVCYSGPTTPNDLELTTGAAACTPRGGSHSTGILIAGVAGDEYQWEYGAYFEYAGRSVGGKTPSDSDPVQFGKAVQATKTQTGESGPLKPQDSPSVWEKFKTFVGESLPYIVNGAKAIGGAVATIVSKNPRFLMTAAEGVAGLIKGGQPDMRTPMLTDRQRSAFMLVEDEPRFKLGRTFNVYDLYVRGMFNWIVRFDLTNSKIVVLPIPIVDSFVYDRGEFLPDNIRSQLLFNCFDLYTETKLTEEQVNNWINNCQLLLDNFFGADPKTITLPEPVKDDEPMFGKDLDIDYDRIEKTILRRLATKDSGRSI